MKRIMNSFIVQLKIKFQAKREDFLKKFYK